MESGRGGGKNWVIGDREQAWYLERESCVRGSVS